MWKEPGLNLENHEGLLAVLSDGYKDICRIETDYSMEGAPQLKTRIEAFLEMMGKGVKV